MTNKQYTFECIENNCLIYEEGVWLKIEEVVDLLNSQSKLISAYMYEFPKINKENKKLKEENEQLKKENVRFKRMLENLGYKVVMIDE